jgi:hypothetical protein
LGEPPRLTVLAVAEDREQLVTGLGRQVILTQHAREADRVADLLDVGRAAIPIAQVALEAPSVARGEIVLGV